MCDLGLVLGLAAGAANVAGKVAASNANQKMVKQQADIEQTTAARELIVEQNAANKEAAQAVLEGDRAKSAAVASGAGMTGNTPGLRVAEQARQTALSIASAKDRSEAAHANYQISDRASVIAGNNKMATMKVSPMAALTDIATSGFSNYGAFA